MRKVLPRVFSAASVTASFSFEAGSSGANWWRLKSTSPEVRSTATAALVDPPSPGTARARASLGPSGIAAPEPEAAATLATTPPTTRATTQDHDREHTRPFSPPRRMGMGLRLPEDSPFGL